MLRGGNTSWDFNKYIRVTVDDGQMLSYHFGLVVVIPLLVG